MCEARKKYAHLSARIHQKRICSAIKRHAGRDTAHEMSSEIPYSFDVVNDYRKLSNLRTGVYVYTVFVCMCTQEVLDVC